MDNSPAVKQNGGALVSADQRRGFEEPTEKEDLQIPRAKLLQALSPEVVAGDVDPSNNQPLRPGLIINSLTKQILPVEFIPVFKFTNWIRFNPRNPKDPQFDPLYGAGDVIWRSNDPLDPRVVAESKFGPNGEVPLAKKFINFFAYFPGVNMPVIVSFSKTSLSAGRRLLSLAQFSGEDMFARKYKLSAKQEVGDAGTYFVLNVDPVGKCSEGEFSVAVSLWDNYHTKPIQVHDEVPDEGVSQ